MSKAQPVHVYPRYRQWAVRRAGAQRAAKVFSAKPDAVAWARPRASVLFIHGADGRIEQRVAA